MTQVAELTEQVAALAANRHHIASAVTAWDTFSGIVLTNAVISQLLIDDVSGELEWATFKGTAGCRETTRGRPGQATGVPRCRPR